MTRESLRSDRKALPPGMTYDDKYYIGFWEDSELTAVMDLILRYPDRDTAYIGFFMVNRSAQGRGVGSLLVEEVCGWLKRQGFTCVRLGYAKGDPQSEHFWRKNRFRPTGMEAAKEGYDAVLLQRTL